MTAILALATGTTEGLDIPDMSEPHGPPGVLRSADVARIWTEEARNAVRVRARHHSMRRDLPGDTRCAECGLTRGAKVHRGPAPAGDITVAVSTVWSYSKESRRPGGRYIDKPMPQPDGYLHRNRQGPWWLATREQELRDWWNGRPTQAHGTGGRRAGSTRTAGT